MLYNVVCWSVLGTIAERRAGHWYVLCAWLIAGGLGTLFSTFFDTPPWNLGTGASQAVLGLAGFETVLAVKGRTQSLSLSLKVVLALAITPAFLLDVISVGHPKPGHVLSFIVGALLAMSYLRRMNRPGFCSGTIV
jgi:membrane associated rhomboid family serine protease